MPSTRKQLLVVVDTDDAVTTARMQQALANVLLGHTKEPYYMSADMARDLAWLRCVVIGTDVRDYSPT